MLTQQVIDLITASQGTIDSVIEFIHGLQTAEVITPEQVAQIEALVLAQRAQLQAAIESNPLKP